METSENFSPRPEESIDADQFISCQCDQQANDIIGEVAGIAFDTSVADSIEKELRMSTRHVEKRIEKLEAMREKHLIKHIASV